MTAVQPTKRDQIVDELRRRILSGELARGERMPQDELARQFGASITPVREAMRQLEAEGLLVSEPHRGVRVAGVDVDEVTATYVVRRLDSPERAAQSHEEHLTILSAVEEGDLERVAAATELHIRNGLSAILSRLGGSSGPDPFDDPFDTA